MTKHDYQYEVVQKLREAGSLKAEGKYEKAVTTLLEVIALDPVCAPAFNNLGAIYFICKNYDLAVEAYHAALDIRPDYLDAYYNLGLAYIKIKSDEDAMMAFRSLIALIPDHPGAHFQLGCILMRRSKFKEASDEFALIVAAHPNHFESFANLASCYLRQGKMQQAVTTYLQALDIIPDDADTLFNLGVIHIQQGYTEDGLNYYLRAVKSRPDFFDAHHNLGTVYLMRRKQKEALYHLNEALRIKPENEPLRHAIKIVTRDKEITGSPPEFIRSLFDSYAEYYDEHMQSHLLYQAPEKLIKLLEEAGITRDKTYEILDLGSGTGICGKLLRPYAKYLTGVDLSPGMLDVARQKQVYDDLILDDAYEYLLRQSSRFDLIFAADVLVYFGDLMGIIRAASQAIKPGGYFAFNVEMGTDTEFTLTESGRFAHHQDYLRRLAELFGFAITMIRSDTLREHEGRPVEGYLCLWCRLAYLC